MGFKFKKQSLKVRDDEKTNAAELTLKQSIYPLALVTILFFLWVSILHFCTQQQLSKVKGVFIWTPRYFEQAFSKNSRDYES
jgi:hypothetical protein